MTNCPEISEVCGYPSSPSRGAKPSKGFGVLARNYQTQILKNVPLNVPAVILISLIWFFAAIILFTRDTLEGCEGLILWFISKLEIKVTLISIIEIIILCFTNFLKMNSLKTIHLEEFIS
ncbi:hypothetical protein Lfee_1257 [Legionella feeleii]|uniref:Uncharacterized protein n=2 Tax=Legionella feeleii TaxID=453 RepID=A0A0W0TXH7_9GAMM|nr:hypothetical protein [Legionella feeleii]KTD00398.1 hypothetical protein Lfee_1257 [Legionella feeleii]SPX59798.1 Uncharacterised protein [Legionella feeleii]